MSSTSTRDLRFEVADQGSVGAIFMRPPGARWLYVLAHGAGADMRHRFMTQMAEALAVQSMATFRFQFPYSEAGRRRPDPAPVLEETVRCAVAVAAGEAPDLSLLAGGKSMGGRMASRASAERPLAGVLGLVFLGFPLHVAGRPSVERAEHLRQVGIPMLFLSGDRDALAEIGLLRSVCSGLDSRARLHVVPNADHSFNAPKGSGRTQSQTIEELAATIATWSASLD